MSPFFQGNLVCIILLWLCFTNVTASSIVRQGCFSGSVSVEERDRGFVSLSELNVGDWIRGHDSEWVQLVAWMHRDDYSVVQFVEILFADKRVALTENHFIYVLRNGEKEILPAMKVQDTDFLIDASGEPVLIKSIQIRLHRGMYAPLSSSGELIVEGVQASCFVQIPLPAPFYQTTHTLGLVGTFPIRHFPMWLSSSLWNTDINSDEYHGACEQALTLLFFVNSVWESAASCFA
jgi:hypothetical protein